MVLTLALGVPGSAACAVFIGALIMKGLQPGPQLMRNNPIPVFTFFAGFLLVNILFFIIGHLFIQAGGQVVRTPLQILAPCILVFCVLGAYASSNSLVNVNIMVISGLAAYFLGKNAIPHAAFHPGAYPGAPDRGQLLGLSADLLQRLFRLLQETPGRRIHDPGDRDIDRSYCLRMGEG